MSGFIEKVVGDTGDKRRCREYRERVKALPGGYRAAAEALELYRGAITKAMPIREVVGAGPVEFAETLLAKYAAGEWIDKWRQRLVYAIARAEAENGGVHA